MPSLPRPGFDLHYAWSGAPGGPVLLLANSLGTDLTLWEPQVAALGTRHRLLRYDFPGHGASGPCPAHWRIDDLGADVLALLDHLGLGRIDVCGLSLGGMVATWLAARAPHRVRRLVLACTAARIPAPSLLRGRLETIRRDGLAAIEDGVLDRWFTPGHAATHPGPVAAARAMLRRTTATGYATLAEAVCALDLRPAAPSITAPTLVLYGTADRATPPEWNLDLCDRIPGARALPLPAAHLANLEAAPAFTTALQAFLA